MKAMTKILAISSLILLPSLALAQFKEQKMDVAGALRPSKAADIIGLLGLDPSKFSMSHSYSIAFGGGNGLSYNSGLYLNTMRYQISNPLSLHLQIGFQHQPFGNQVGNVSLDNQLFISRAGLEYKPTKNMGLYLEFSQTPAYRYYNSPFQDPFYGNRSSFKSEDAETEE